MTTKRSWTDQPAAVEGLPILCNTRIGNAVQVEVRAAGPAEPHWVTAGNLFGSQTVRCQDAYTAFKLIGLLDPDKTLDLPDGAELVEA